MGAQPGLSPRDGLKVSYRVFDYINIFRAKLSGYTSLLAFLSDFWMQSVVEWFWQRRERNGRCNNSFASIGRLNNKNITGSGY